MQKLNRLGFSNARIARFLVVDPRTVARYLKMSEDDYERYLIRSSHRKKVLDPYESFILEQLFEYPDTSAAQIHDWLKEQYDDLPDVSPRTVYNFVMYVRQEHNIPCVAVTRSFFPVEDLPYGKQAQVDFGMYNIRMTNGRRKKIYFFTMVLARSRFKFTLYRDAPFTAEAVVTAHEKAFMFFGGIPQVIVYDLDKTIVVDENLGDIILTGAFKHYAKTRNFELHFCRKSDPQSKGKVENVIQYIKKNFLYNRVYHDIETLNEQSIAWLARTANHLPHNYTKKSPRDEFVIEKAYLKPYNPLNIKNTPEMKQYTVRKHNVIAYKSNFYTVPEGTYQGSDTIVLVKEEHGIVYIYDIHQNRICSHQRSYQKGKTIRNTHHKRDTSKSLEEMSDRVIACFTHKEQAQNYISQIKQEWPRYIRDHLQAILKSLNTADRDTADKTLDFCMKNTILHGNEFEQALQVFIDEKSQEQPATKDMKLLHTHTPQNIMHIPQKSNIEDYENIMNQKQKNHEQNRSN
ncbi:MAG: IS21 family transposase [Petrotogales bacterium]